MIAIYRVSKRLIPDGQAMDVLVQQGVGSQRSGHFENLKPKLEPRCFSLVTVWSMSKI